MFCNQHYPNHLCNKLSAGVFPNITYQSLVLSSLAIHKFCDEYRRHLSSSCCDLSSMRTWSLFSLFSCQIHPYIIYLCSRHTYLVILQRLLPSTSIFSGVIVSYHFWWVIASLPLRVFRPNLGTRFFLGGRLWHFMYL
jgi:hypothetical protein